MPVFTFTPGEHRRLLSPVFRAFQRTWPPPAQFRDLALVACALPGRAKTLAHVGRDQGRLWSVSKKRQNFLSLLQRTPLLSVYRLSAAESPAPLLSLLRAVCLRLTLQLHLHRTPRFPRSTFLKVSSLYCLWLPLATCLRFPFPPFPAPASCSLFYSHWTRPAKG